MWLSPASLYPHRALEATCLGSAMGRLGTRVQVGVLDLPSHGQKAGHGSSGLWWSPLGGCLQQGTARCSGPTSLRSDIDSLSLFSRFCVTPVAGGQASDPSGGGHFGSLGAGVDS